MYISLVVMLVFVCGIGISLARSVQQIRVMIKPRGTGTGRPECAKCRYDVSGVLSIERLRCPECGSELLDVGILGRVGVENARQAIMNGIAGIVFLSLMLTVVGMGLVLALIVLSSDRIIWLFLIISTLVWVLLSLFGTMLAMRYRRRSIAMAELLAAENRAALEEKLRAAKSEVSVAVS